MTVLEHFADWASLTSAGDFPPLAFERAGLAFEDTIGCMIAGANDAATNSVRRSVAQWGTGGARAIGTQARLPASWAALINGTAAHALDFDDEFLPALTHASAVLVSALLALAEEHGSTGEGVLAAYIVGVELNAALGRGLIRSHYDAGWHATSTIGTIAAAGACARLMGLDQHQIANAMSLGVSVAAGCKAQFGSSAKPLHAGFAAQHAIESAKLAACGVEGNLDVLEGPMGFLDLYGGPSPAGWELPYQELGKPLAIVGEGLMAKRFPCCTATHRALDCFLRLRDEQAFTVADVDSLDIVVGYGHKRNLMYDLPETAAQARFSMHYCISRTSPARNRPTQTKQCRMK
jgi:2-methylcitrate dehydratase PrpD